MTQFEQRTLATDTPFPAVATDQQRTNGQSAGQSNGQGYGRNGQPSNGQDGSHLVMGPSVQQGSDKTPNDVGRDWLQRIKNRPDCPECKSSRTLVGPSYDRHSFRCLQCGCTWTGGATP